MTLNWLCWAFDEFNDRDAMQLSNLLILSITSFMALSKIVGPAIKPVASAITLLQYRHKNA
jgi:hypothetical protein